MSGSEIHIPTYGSMTNCVVNVLLDFTKQIKNTVSNKLLHARGTHVNDNVIHYYTTKCH